MALSRRAAALSTMTGATANTAIVALQAFVLIPLYLAAVGPRLYGAWLGSGDVLMWMQAMDFGLPNLLIQRIGAADGRGDRSLVLGYFASGVVTLAVIASALGTIGVLIAPAVPGWMRLQGAEAATLSGCFGVGAVASAVVVFNNSVVGLSRGVQRTALMNAMLVGSAVVGLVVSAAALVLGWGLWAIPAGIGARAIVSLAGSAVFVATFLRGADLAQVRPSGKLIREMTMVSPATALAGIGYAVMSQSEAAFVSVLVRPELAPVLVLTRKAADLARSVIDTIGYSVYGGFAHLIASPDRHRAPLVYAQIRTLRLSLAVATAAAFIAVNKPLLSLWVGDLYYGGLLLTSLIAVQLIVVGSSYLANYLYRATGEIVRGSLLLIVECGVRVPLMAGLLVSFGLSGLVSASTITAAVLGLVAYRLTLGAFGAELRLPEIDNRWLHAARIGVLGIGIVTAVVGIPRSWLSVLAVGAVIGGGAFAAQVALDPLVTWSDFLRRPRLQTHQLELE
jgi:hypothetical protein